MLEKVIPPGDPTLAVAYISASTEATDRPAIEAWARREGMTIVRWHIETSDVFEKPAFQAAIADLPIAGAGRLIAASRDRIGAQFFGVFSFVVNAHGARLVCADGGHLPEGDQRCPTCKTPVETSTRYPRALCGLCMHEATDERGRPLCFSNLDTTGGFRAVYADTGEARRGHVCYVHGVKCIADEAYMGGIVIQPEK